MKKTSSLHRAHTDAERIFRSLLPAHGLAIRQAQIELCHEMLDAMFLGRVSLCDAGVGIGKTHAYLVAGILWQKYRPRGLPRTLTVSTSSIALQNAITKEYLPALSRILVKDGQLAKPIRAVIRKGRERYVCDWRLMQRMKQASASKRVNAARKAALRQLCSVVDLDEAVGLSGFDRAHVCVPEVCPENCPMWEVCRYQAFLKRAKGEKIDIQICNHNYLLADAMHRQQGLRPLLKDYHILIVDEAHKLPDAAQQMYGQTVSLAELVKLQGSLKTNHLLRAARRLAEATEGLKDSFQGSSAKAMQEESFVMTPEWAEALEQLCRTLQTLAQPCAAMPRGLGHQLEKMAELFADFRDENPEKVLYIQYDCDGAPTFYADSRRLPEQLARDLWQRGTPAVLTSGTLAAGGSFARPRQRMGLEQLARCREFTVRSPFDYRHNMLLYLPTAQGRKGREDAGAAHLYAQIRQLINAAHGHALVLFTSYTLMSEAHRALVGTLPFPLFAAWRGNQQAVRQFKRESNAVLFAAGPCWEGIDFPGDQVSLLIIVRLPFLVPNPLSEAEQEGYPDLQSYIRTVVVPQMQTKLRQGVGRAIRTETDSCVVAILDGRAAPGGRYSGAVKDALPPCPATGSLRDVEQFIRARKDPEYFLPRGAGL